MQRRAQPVAGSTVLQVRRPGGARGARVTGEGSQGHGMRKGYCRCKATGPAV